MKASLKLFALLGVLSSSLSAATLTGTSFNFTGGQVVSGGVLVNGAAATPGQATANFGFFAAGFDVAAAVSSNNYGSLFSNFTLVSTADVGNTTNTFGENYAGLFDSGAGPFTTDAASIGRTIYGFYNAGAGFSASNIANGYALFSSGQTIIADTFPPTDYTMFAGSGTFVGGSQGSGIVPSTFTATAVGESNVAAPGVNIVVIPEPSAALLGALGALGLLRRRRN